MDSWISGLVDILFGLVLGIFNIFLGIATSGLALDGEDTLGGFFALFPFCNEAYGFFTICGVVILYMICVFQLFKSMFGPLTEAESPLILVFKTIMFTGLIFFAKDICQAIINLGSVFYDALGQINGFDQIIENMTTIDANDLLGLLFDGVTQIVAILVLIFLFILMMKEVFKLVLEVTERYVILGLLSVISPLCIATGASRATNRVFKSFITMYISQVIVMCFSLFFLKGFTNGYLLWWSYARGENTIPPFNGSTSYTMPNILTQGLMLITWLKLGQKVDAHMSQLGLNVAQAGGMADSFMAHAQDRINANMNPNSLTALAQRGLMNKFLGTNFKPNEAPVRALLSGNLSKKAAMRDAMNHNKGNNKTTKGQMNAANDRINAAAAKIKKGERGGMPCKESLDMLNSTRGTNNSYGGGAAGLVLADSMKDNLNLGEILGVKNPEKLTPVGAMFENGVAHLEYKDEDGNLHSFDVSNRPGVGNVAEVETTGIGAWKGEALYATNMTAPDMNAAKGIPDSVIDDKSDNSYESVKNAGEHQPIENNNGDNVAKPEDSSVINGDKLSSDNLDDATRWTTDENGNAVALQKPNEDDAQFNEDGKFDQEKFNEAMEEYNNASLEAPDGNIYGAGATIDEDNNIEGDKLYDSADLENATRWDGNEAIQKPDKDDAQFNEDGKFDQEKFNEAMEEYNNASLEAPDGNIYGAGADIADNASFEVNSDDVEAGATHWDGNEAIQPPNADDAQFNEGDKFDQEKFDEAVAKYDAASEKAPDGQIYKAGATADENGKVSGDKLDNITRWNGNEAVQPPKASDFTKDGKFDQAGYNKAMERYNNASTVAPDGKVYSSGASMGADGKVNGNEKDVSSFAAQATRWNGNTAVQPPKASDFMKNGKFDQAGFNKAVEKYNNASIKAPDGKTYGAGATATPMSGGPQIPQLYTGSGQKVNANELVRYGSDGQAIHPPVQPQQSNYSTTAAFNNAQKQYSQDLAKYNAASPLAPDNKMYKSDNGRVGEALYTSKPENMPESYDASTLKAKQSSGQRLEKDNSSSMAISANNGTALKVDKNGERGILAKTPTGHVQTDNGKFVYNESNDSFQKISSLPKDGTISGTWNKDGFKSDIAGTFKNSAGQEVSAKEAMGEGGSKVKDGYSFQPTRFDSMADSKSEKANELKSQSASGNGILLQTNPTDQGHQGVTRCNVDGTANANGNFVKLADNSLVSLNAFEQGQNGNVHAYSLENISANVGDTSVAGAMNLQKTDDGSAIQTYNLSSDGKTFEKAEGGTGAYVAKAGLSADEMKDHSNYYSASSFATNNDGAVQGHSVAIGSPDSAPTYDNLLTHNGQAQRFDGHANASDTGNFYKTESGDIVPIDNYETNAAGATSLYSTNATSYGSRVKDLKTGQYKTLVDGGTSSQPMTYDKDEATGTFSLNASGEGQYVQTMGKGGSTDYTKVRESGSEPLDTYNMKPVDAVFKNLDGSRMVTTGGGYENVGLTGGQYCELEDGSKAQIASFNDDRSMKMYSSDGQGGFKEDENGTHAMVGSNGQISYEPVKSQNTFNQVQTTEHGIVANHKDGNNNPMVTLNDSNYKESQMSDGGYRVSIGGVSYDAYDAETHQPTKFADNSNAFVMEIGDRKLLMTPTEFEVSSNQNIAKQVTGRSAENLCERLGQAYNKNISFHQTSGNSFAMCDTSVPRKWNEKKQQYERPVTVYSFSKPESGNYETLRDPNTNRPIYAIKAAEVSKKPYGNATAQIAYPPGIRENENKQKPKKIDYKSGIIGNTIKKVIDKNPFKKK